MPRPPKKGLDWFKLDTSLDDKIQLIEAECGLLGFAIVLKLLQKVYRDEGYFCRWTEREGFLFSRNEAVRKEEAETVVAKAVKYELFDESLFSAYGILTSRGIQKRYFAAIGERTGDVELIGEYLLVEPPDRPNVTVVYPHSTVEPVDNPVDNSDNSDAPKNQSGAINPINRPINSIDRPGNDFQENKNEFIDRQTELIGPETGFIDPEVHRGEEINTRRGACGYVDNFGEVRNHGPPGIRSEEEKR